MAAREPIRSNRYCADPGTDHTYNVLTVDRKRAFDASALQRNVYATSSCGICGKAAIDQIEVGASPLADGPVVARRMIVALPARLRDAQRVFASPAGCTPLGSSPEMARRSPCARTWAATTPSTS